MTGIDFITAVFVLAGLVSGVARGFIGTLIDLIGIFAGLTVASIVYKAPTGLLAKFKITGTPVDLICFILSALLFIFSIILLLELLRKKKYTKLLIDRIFGFFLGFIEGLIFASGLLIIMSSSFSSAQDVEQSKLAKYVIRFIPKVYEEIERKGITFPKMIISPASYQDEFKVLDYRISFKKINFTKLDGATCLKCGGKVKFEGYFPKVGAALVPKFKCSKCGRISDGCQTYEGYHLLYGNCPVKLAKEGQRFDCGNWRNFEWITPKGPCPVCGEKIDLWQWQPPVPYNITDVKSQ